MEKINTDSLPSEDLLDRRRFAVEIAKNLRLSFKKEEDSFVFGLNGKWGSGKTTLMTYLKEALEGEVKDSKNVIIFEFNPWMFSGKEDLVSFFLRELSKKLSATNENLKSKLSLLAKGLSFAENVKYFHSGLGEVVASLKKVADDLTPVTESVQDLKIEIDKIIVKEGLRLFVFIDDLDRLTPKEVIEIFQIIKLNASFKNTIFLVSFDKEVVCEILDEHYGFDGERYLEKIIQVDYRIPDLLDETIEQIFFSHLINFFDELSIKYNEDEFRVIWLVEKMKFYFVTLRDIHRYFNALKLRLPSIKDDVDISQFCIIESIRIFDYSSYEIIQKNYKRGVFFGPQTQAQKEIAQTISNESTKALFQYLFKPISAKSKYAFSDPQYFDRYFALSIGKRDINHDTIKIFLRDSNMRPHIIQNAITKDSISSLFLNLLKEKNIDLYSVNPLIRWQAESELSFINNKEAFIKTLGHIIDSNNDFAKGINYIVSILGSDDGYFNPARFYLVYFLNETILTQDVSVFAKYRDVILNNQKSLENIERDILKKYENDNLVFQRPYFKTNFVHKLFLLRYRKYFREEYNTKLDVYLNAQSNLFLFIEFLSSSESKDITLDEWWVSNLLDSRILNVLNLRINEIIVDGLTSEYKSLYDFFINNRETIGAIITKIEVSLSTNSEVKP